MALLPDYDHFAEGYDAGNNQVVYTRIAADLDTPVSLMLKLSGAGKNAFMLESVTGGEVRGRYSIVGMNPDLIWECRGTASRLNRNARFDDSAFETCKEDPLTALADAGYTDLAAAELGSEASSFVFDGQSGTLDYALANDSLAAELSGAAVWNINADEADALQESLDWYARSNFDVAPATDCAESATLQPLLDVIRAFVWDDHTSDTGRAA